MSRTLSPTLWRVVTGQGIIPRPHWLERLMTGLDRTAPVIDPAQLTDKQLADLGLSRDDILRFDDAAGWNPPEYWMHDPQADCIRGQG